MAVYAEGLALALDRLPAVRVVCAVVDGHGCLEGVGRCDPDVVLLDLATDGALPLIGDLLAASERVKVVVLAVPEIESAVIMCAEAGVAGYVTRDDKLEDVVAVLAAVERDEMRCSARTAAILLRRVRAQAGLRPSASGRDSVHLTRREADVLGLMGEGLSNKQIAQRLFIALPTVKNHVHHILEKLDARGRADAVAWAHGPAGRREIRFSRPGRLVGTGPSRRSK